MEEETSEGRLLATFEEYQQFTEAQREFLSLDLDVEPTPEEDRREGLLLRRLSNILDEYQEQSYLLDPFLEELVTPVVLTLKGHAKRLVSGARPTNANARVGKVALLLYSFVKFRGYKSITRFFPHEVSDLSIALDYMLSPESPVHKPPCWALRYVVLLWLSLICMIPFDLEQFDERDSVGETAAKLESLGKVYLSKAGLEKEGAAILLSRLYTRKDTSDRLNSFLEWSIATSKEPMDPFPTIGSLQVLGELVKSGPVEQVKSHMATLLEVADTVQNKQSFMSNTLIRKLRTKLISRVILRLLPANTGKARSRGRALAPESLVQDDEETASIQDDYDVPGEVEMILDELFKALQDKDTIVRWSAAKGIARISERLPSGFTEQVLETIIGLFSIHSIAAASVYDMPTIAESTWHGACLACAEIARRGLVADDKLPELIDWLSKALYFDIRKGAHSIGSNVRDAASYVLWSLARAQRVSVLAPHAEKLSRHLVTVSIFDREIHIRRAASATFQEYVGRTNLFAHGIDVLQKTDFYAVGIRRHAFLVAAPKVAEHNDYRDFLISHLLNVTLRHWDPSMRQLGSQSLRAICQLDLRILAPSAAHRTSVFLKGPDTADIHGALLALTELAAAFRDSAENFEQERRKIFSYLADVPMHVVESPRYELVTASACLMIASSISVEETNPSQTSVPHWRKIVDIGLKSRSTIVQEAAVTALAAVSQLVDCSAIVERLIREFSVGSPQMQQSSCRVLGVLAYDAHPHGLQSAVKCLLTSVDGSSSEKVLTVEARRNAYASLPQILTNVSPRLYEHLTPQNVCAMIDALQEGLCDYTTDERGDVGSWIRVTCVKGLASFAETLFAVSGQLPNFAEYFPPSKYHDAIGGILKQGVERLDNVRQQTGECFLRLLALPLPAVADAGAWRICGDDKMKGLFLSETVGWNEGEKLFPKAVRLLDIQRYREQVLGGLVLSASTKTDSTQRPVTAGLIAYARTLPATPPGTGYSLHGLAQDLLAQARRNVTSNNIVVPVLQTFNILLEADVFESLPGDPVGLQSLRSLLSLVTRNISRLKNHQRIIMSMRIVVYLLPMAQLRKECLAQLTSFLTHQYPKVRSDTAEHLYLILQSKDLGVETDDAEDILLETEWSSNDMETVLEAAQRCVQLISVES
ncbi:ARM repeat-containing protein [Wolfiporia cocos MD-104 SS10]|uniref:ARM repeat-containing protein n=1 Tax=Wolfiporia cocos (strain MD-104) TaxID=742152 RepID=A0A2H3JJQ1_WOLCO|nr:ARM repeat-containing protein [Wolfiporia cocos MD-104 SS10]